MKGKVKTIALFLVLALLFNIFAPTISVIAAVSGEVTINFSGPWDVDGASVDASRNGTVTIDADEEITLTNFDADKMRAYIEASDGFTANLTVTDGKTKISTADCDGLPGGTIDFKVASLNGDGTGEANTFKIKATNTEFGTIRLNDEVVKTDENGSFTSDEFVVDNIGYANDQKTNKITIQEAYGSNPIVKVVINNETYTDSSSNVNITDDGWEIRVPGSALYDIEATGDSNFVAPVTIIWTNPDYVPADAEDAAWIQDFKIDHGYARIIEVYDENNNLLSPSSYINTMPQPDGSASDNYGIRDGFGWVKLNPNYRAVFEFVPEYGYQLTSISLNGAPGVAQTAPNRFEITIQPGGGNVHFAATFTKTDNIVKPESVKVESGTIDLGNTLDFGTAQLKVNDVTLSSDKIAGFEAAAGEYTISDYLDIDLYQVTYKGKNDSDDVWENKKIDELTNEATISIKLEDGVTADDIVIVHNIHDGDEYEVIEIDSYDAATNTITFKTKSFSNYAIASKTTDTTTDDENITTTTEDNTEKTNTSSNPTTGDNIITIVTIFAIATLGTFTTMKLNKNRRVRKH